MIKWSLKSKDLDAKQLIKAEQGKAIIMVSSELPEILGVSDRIMVMCEGRVTAELENEGLTEEDVIKYAFAT